MVILGLTTDMLGMGEKIKQCHHVFIVQQTCSACLPSCSLVNLCLRFCWFVAYVIALQKLLGIILVTLIVDKGQDLSILY